MALSEWEIPDGVLDVPLSSKLVQKFFCMGLKKAEVGQLIDAWPAGVALSGRGSGESAPSLAATVSMTSLAETGSETSTAPVAQAEMPSKAVCGPSPSVGATPTTVATQPPGWPVVFKSPVVKIINDKEVLVPDPNPTISQDLRERQRQEKKWKEKI